MALDTLILNASVIDGLGKPRYKADIGIQNNRIEVIGNLKEAASKQKIDASGLVVSPGFIDMHSHSDVTLLDDPRGESKIHQGVTTEVTGNCGTTPYPSGIYTGIELREQLPIHPLPESPSSWPWQTLDGWATYLEETGIGINLVPQVGHTTIKYAAGVPNDRPATGDELGFMRRLSAESVEQGAVSLTNGLTGPNFTFAPTSEIVSLIEAIKPYNNSFYASHARLGTGQHFKAVEEAIAIGNQCNIPVQFSHIAITDSNYHGRAAELVSLIEKARSSGLDITYDVYPYTAAGVSLRNLLPQWMEIGGALDTQAKLCQPELRVKASKELEKESPGSGPWRWDGIVISKVSSTGDSSQIGKSLEEISAQRNSAPLETLFDLILEDGNIECVFHNRNETDVQYFVSHQLSMIGTDGMAISPQGIWGPTKINPRFYGSYPRILGRYVRDYNLISLEDAIHKMSGFPAQRLNLKNRGMIVEGCVADIVIFNPDTIIDNATFEDPHQYPEGIHYVFLNGKKIISEGHHTGALAGKILRRGSMQ